MTLTTLIKKSLILLSMCGAKTYSLFRNLTTPAKPAEKTYTELKTLLRKHLKPKPLVIDKCFKFHQRKQETGEMVSQFVTELRKLTEYCESGAFLNRCH